VASVAVIGCGDAQRPTRAPLGDRGFAVLTSREPTGARPPAQVIASLQKSQDPAFSNRDIADARAISPLGGVWLVPNGESDLCLVRLIAPLIPVLDGEHLPDGVIRSCATARAASQGRLVEVQALVTSRHVSGRNLVVGIVPDGVRSVTISLLHGSRHLSVARNSFGALVGIPTALTFADPNGVVQRVRLQTFAPSHPADHTG
jgi:hypothetical protein